MYIDKDLVRLLIFIAFDSMFYFYRLIPNFFVTIFLSRILKDQIRTTIWAKL